MNYIVSVLDAAFRGRKVVPSTCISMNSLDYFLIEDNIITKTCVFADPINLTEEEIAQGYFSVYNKNHKEIHLWAVDGCFMSSKVGTRCDCALFTDNEFCFVEFKLNATTSIPEIILEHRQKATNQLKATIDLLFDALSKRNLSLSIIQFEAYICSPPKFPSKDTSLPDERIEFLETYGIMLFEANEKKFN